MSGAAWAPGPGWTLHLADSEISGVEPEPGGWRLRLSAAALQAPDGTVGFATGLALLLSLPVPQDDAPQIAGRIREGRVRLDGHWLTKMALPCVAVPAQRIELQTSQGDVLEADLLALSVQSMEAARFHESLAC